VGQLRRRSRGEGGGRLSQAASEILDLSGAEELCSEPAPLERVRRRLSQLEPGARLEVRTPVAEHAFAVRAWGRKNGVSVVADERTPAGFTITLEV
jgi:TusA-related sulfurtransferase